MIQVGERLPTVTLRRMGEQGIEAVTTDDFFAGRRVALIGVPGAFTPSCSAQHLPGYVEQADALKAKGVDEVACVAVNDPFVMAEWAKAKGADGKVTLLSDGNGDFAEATGLAFDGSGLGLGTRLKRFAMVVDDGRVSSLRIEDDPAAVEVTAAEKLMADL